MAADTAPVTEPDVSVNGAGEVWGVAGPVVTAAGLPAPRLYNLVHVGVDRIPGEVIRLDGDRTVIQVYEDASGLTAGEPVVDSGRPLEVELGPGLLGSIFDGIQRPLDRLAAISEGVPGAAMLARGADAPALDRTRQWQFEPTLKDGAAVVSGDILGLVHENGSIVQRVLVPPGRSGTLDGIRSITGTVDQPVAWVDGAPLSMLSRWPVRESRPVQHKLDATTPLVTGQRVIDSLFPLALGGAAAIPGGFGTGKTMLEQSIAKWARADIVVYVGCGERGNELTEVLEEFPQLTDPRTGGSLMDRTILIANTSNMPVAARESSIYTAMTLAEYYRDQGYDVALLADSTSRWAEALREVSGRLEEMPAEEGYPAYLASRLAEFYERAGRVRCLGAVDRQGSVSVVGAVSPAGGDFSEPVTQHSLRMAGTFWALDAQLARQRHFPAIGWTDSYTLYRLDEWFDREVAAGFSEQRRWALRLLQRESEVLEALQLLGPELLSAEEKLILQTGRVLREAFLRQSAFDERDAYCSLDRQYQMLRVIHAGHAASNRRLAEQPEGVETSTVLRDVGQMRDWPDGELVERADALIRRLARREEAS